MNVAKRAVVVLIGRRVGQGVIVGAILNGVFENLFNSVVAVKCTASRSGGDIGLNHLAAGDRGECCAYRGLGGIAGGGTRGRSALSRASRIALAARASDHALAPFSARIVWVT